MTDELQALSAALAGQFDVIRELGRGGMGIVTLARDLKLDRLVAIKVLPSALSNDDARMRFLREARMSAQLAHPNIVPIYRADEANGLAFFVMGYVDGESLAERIQLRGAIPTADVIPWLRDVAWALAYAHARGVVHRDVKPENIMVERATGRAIVTDFGIARDLAADGLTATGHILGTVHYMSPEQCSGDTLDGRSDLYALGVVGFHLLSGRVPFAGLAAHAVLVANVTRPTPSLCSVAPQVPREVGAVIDRCLSKRAEDRYDTGEQLADALAKALADTQRDARESASSSDLVLSEPAAEALWKRAAQLQAESLQRIDAKRSNVLPSTTGTGATPVTGYRVDHVKQAAVEAGISAQFIELAIAELPRDGRGAPMAIVAAESRTERYASLMLGTNDKSLSVTRVIHAPPARVLQSLGTVWRQSPWNLLLRAPQGGHPLDGGVLVFDLPGQIMLATPNPVSSEWTSTRQALEAKQLQVTLREAPGIPNATEVTVFCDLRPGIRRNVLAAGWIGGIVGTVGSVLAAGIANKAALIIGALTVAGPAVATGVGLVGLTVMGYRVLYRNEVSKARAEIEKALDAVDGGIQSEELFGSLADRQR